MTKGRRIVCRADAVPLIAVPVSPACIATAAAIVRIDIRLDRIAVAGDLCTGIERLCHARSFIADRAFGTRIAAATAVSGIRIRPDISAIACDFGT